MTTATVSSAPAASSTPLAGAMALAGADLKAVDALILERVGGEVPLIRDITRHIVASGGKRLRPLLTLLSARLCGYSGTRHIGLAASVEFIHTATLLHDDVVDESKLRRGLATANELFGNKASVLVGDFLLAQAFQLMVADGSLKTLKILSDAAAIISKGEVKQLMTEGEPETAEAHYLDVITSKTAALFAAACELGAVVADLPQHEERLARFGNAIGIAFQLVDDALDYCADEATLGKTVGDDFREGKVTLPVILAYRASTPQEQAFWQRTIAEGNRQEGDLAQAVALIEKYHGITETFARARHYCDEALSALSPFPENAAKNVLREVVDFCVERMY